MVTDKSVASCGSSKISKLQNLSNFPEIIVRCTYYRFRVDTLWIFALLVALMFRHPPNTKIIWVSLLFLFFLISRNLIFWSQWIVELFSFKLFIIVYWLYFKTTNKMKNFIDIFDVKNVCRSAKTILFIVACTLFNPFKFVTIQLKLPIVPYIIFLLENLLCFLFFFLILLA